MLNFVDKAYAVAGTDFNFSLGLITDPSATPGGIASVVLNWVLFIAAIIAVIYLVYAGIQYITAGGDAEKATSARTAIVNAIIGIVIIALALVLVRWVAGLVGNAR